LNIIFEFFNKMMIKKMKTIWYERNFFFTFFTFNIRNVIFRSCYFDIRYYLSIGYFRCMVLVFYFFEIWNILGFSAIFGIYNFIINWSLRWMNFRFIFINLEMFKSTLRLFWRSCFLENDPWLKIK